MQKILIILSLVFIFFFTSCTYDKNLYLIIENQTNHTVSNILLNYTSSKEYIEIKTLNSGENYKVKINNSIENSLKIKYIINNNSTEKVAIGYFIKNTKGTKYFIIE